MKAFIGTFINKIDAKGRISVPAPFRTVVQAKGLAGVTLFPSLAGDCIEGCGMDRIEGLVERMGDSPLPTMSEDSIAHLIIGSAREAPFDAGGRIVLPEDFMTRARLTDQGAFVGKGRTFQIWEPSALKAVQDAMMQRLAADWQAQLAGARRDGSP